MKFSPKSFQQHESSPQARAQKEESPIFQFMGGGEEGGGCGQMLQRI